MKVHERTETNEGCRRSGELNFCLFLGSAAYHNSEKQEPDEISVVVLPDAVSHEWAVVVEPEDALAARVAVLGARSLGKGGQERQAGQEAECFSFLVSFHEAARSDADSILIPTSQTEPHLFPMTHSSHISEKW